MSPEVEALLAKAERSIESAAALHARGDDEFAAPRVYYACFYVAEAMLLHQGLDFSRHGQVIAQYGRLFARPAVLDPAFHRLLLDAFHLRQVGDYTATPDIPADEVARLLAEARRFVAAATTWLRSDAGD